MTFHHAKQLAHTVLVCDVVESMRWMRADETAAVAQWQAFEEAVKRQVLGRFGARIVKSLGDGLMLDFQQQPPVHAIKAAFAIQNIALQQRFASVKASNTESASDIATVAARAFWLRIGIHHTPVTVGVDDIYGNGVNLCARIATLAGPGEVIISADMRDQITDQLDADIEDMGECYLKHIDEPVRVYRAGPAGAQPIIVPQREYNTPLQATIAVIPFAARSLAADNQLAVGEIIADGVIGQLSRTRDLKVISRLSTSVFRNRVNAGGLSAVADIEAHLGANYVLSGSYIALDKKLIVTAELAETKTNQIVWMDRLQGDLLDILQLQSELCHTIANAAHLAILDTEVQAALTRPLPTLESYSLLLSGISMMHRTSKTDFERSQKLLTELQYRHSLNGSICTWLAKWHTLKVVSGFSSAPTVDTELALGQTQKALNLNRNDAMALAMRGYVLTHLGHDPLEAGKALDRAVAVSANEPMAWLYRSVWAQMWNDGKDIIEMTQCAMHLSPTDPLQYFFDMVLANAYAYHRQSELAIQAAEKSLKINCIHLPTLRTLLWAQVESGREMEGQKTLARILKISPDFSISKYKSMGNLKSPVKQRVINAFEIVGLRK